MQKPISALLFATLLLAGCGGFSQSRMNPVNWFGQSRSAPVSNVSESTTNPLIPARRESIFRSERDDSYRGWDVREVTAMAVERRPGGALITATGVATYQGPYELRLVKIDEESTGDTLTYALRAVQLRGPQGTPQSRSVTAAQFVTENDLLGIRTIRVKAAGNVRTVNR